MVYLYLAWFDWSRLLLDIYQSCHPPSHRAVQGLQFDLETLKKQVAAARTHKFALEHEVFQGHL